MSAPHRYSIESLPACAVPACVELSLASRRSLVTLSEDELRSALSVFLKSHAEADAAVAARDADGQVVGFASFDSFFFHGERAAFCPLVGHWAAAGDDQATVYEAIYTALAARWVSDGVRKHLFSLPATAAVVERRFVELGFGLYVVDALMPIAGQRSTRPVHGSKVLSLDSARPAPGVTVRAAIPADLGVLTSLVDESVSCYSASPIFLAVDPTPAEELRDLLTSETAAIFLAHDAGGPAGFMGVHRNDDVDPISLIGPRSATLEGLSTLHVDFESANPAARSFWTRYFTPTVHSLIRHTHADVPK